MLHVLITCIDVVFIKTCVNTCTAIEPHLIIICLCYVAHLYPLDVLVQPSFDDSYFLTYILYFCICFHNNIFSFLYMSILSKLQTYMSILEYLLFMQIFIMDSLVFGICMYTYSLDKTYIYLEVCIILMKNKFSQFILKDFVLFYYIIIKLVALFFIWQYFQFTTIFKSYF